MFKFGLETLLEDNALINSLQGQKVGLVAHPASVDSDLNHSVDRIHGFIENNLACAFGPQHGMRGDKQDNMIESDDYKDPRLQIPIYSLYGKVRRPTTEMLNDFDVLIFDLQDLGCRIYTFLTTLFYCMEDCSQHKKSLWVLDRPNPVGRPIEGNLLEKNLFSFVGGATLPMRHGLTLSEAALWYKKHKNLDLDLQIVKMQGYIPKTGAYGWPDKPWINPSPNAPNINMARNYPGSVLLEGTHYSEGRGTTRPLEVFGAPHIEPEKLIIETLKFMKTENLNCHLRPCYFEPTFHKFKGQLCAGIQIHADTKNYNHENFQPYRIYSCLLKVCHKLYPDFKIWSEPPYEYEHEKVPIDLISGSPFLKSWVEDKSSEFEDLDTYLEKDEKAWNEQIQDFLIY